MTTAEIYQRLRPLMFSIAYRMLGSVSEAEDIVQEAFLRYHAAQPRQAEIGSPKAYLSAVPPGCASITCARPGPAARPTRASGCPSRC
jgi:predicted RNA polymerase sigma factor